MQRFGLVALLMGILMALAEALTLENSDRNRFMVKSCMAAESIGANMTMFAHDVTHGIHVVSLEELRYFLDEPSLPENNYIPTLNENLMGRHVLPNTRSFKSMFQFPAGQLIDYALTVNDAVKDRIIEGSTTMEIVSHGAHMHEMLWDIGNEYKKIKANPPQNISDACPCLVDEEFNCVMEYHYILAKLDQLGVRVNEDPKHRGIRYPGMKVNLPKLPERCPPFVYGEVTDVLPANGMLDGVYVNPKNAYTAILEPKDQSSWLTWKVAMLGRNLIHRAIRNTALYLYCKVFHNSF